MLNKEKVGVILRHWLEDIAENLRSGYVLANIGERIIASSSGFSMGNLRNVEDDFDALDDVKYYAEKIGNSEGYIVLKTENKGEYWDFVLDEYCENKKEITKMINDLFERGV
ncbi:MAG: hypothetical protein WC900_06465 [Oscillospiraceae bacterium]